MHDHLIKDDLILYILLEATKMKFMQALAQLQRAYPLAPIGRTASQGQYYDRATRMTFEKHPERPNVFRAFSPRGKEMWLYYSKATGRICCGDKDYTPE